MGFRKIHKLTLGAATAYEVGYCFWLNAFVSATRHM